MTLEDLLRTTVVSKDIAGNDINVPSEFRIAVQNVGEKGVSFIVHPLGVDGDTLDFVVHGNFLVKQ